MANVTHEYVANILTQTGDEELKKFASFIVETKSERSICYDSSYYFMKAQQQLSQKAYERGLEALANDKNPGVLMACARYGSDDIRRMLVRNKNPSVRWACAEYGSDNIKQLVRAYEKSLVTKSLFTSSP